MRLDVFNPCTNEEGTVKDTEALLHGVPYCTASNPLGTVSYSFVSRRIVRGTISNRTESEHIGTRITVYENFGI